MPQKIWVFFYSSVGGSHDLRGFDEQEGALACNTIVWIFITYPTSDLI